MSKNKYSESKKIIFLQDLEQISNDLMFLSDQFRRFQMDQTRITEETKNKMNVLSKMIMEITDEYEALISCRNAPELSDPYYLHMRTLELNRIRKLLGKANSEFRTLKQWVIDHPPEINFSLGISETTISVHDDPLLKAVQDDDELEYYKHLFLRFLRQNLEFYCSKCQYKIYYGEPECENCGTLLSWDYSTDEIFSMLAELPMDHEFKCPVEDCGAPIELDWENCAYCGLDLHKLFNAAEYI